MVKSEPVDLQDFYANQLQVVLVIVFNKKKSIKLQRLQNCIMLKFVFIKLCNSLSRSFLYRFWVVFCTVIFYLGYRKGKCMEYKFRKHTFTLSKTWTLKERQKTTKTN